MKTTIKLNHVFLIMGALAALSLPVVAQQPEQAVELSPLEVKEIFRLVTHIKQQQGIIEENKKKIEAKLSEIQEEVRQARIFAARGAR